MRGLTWTIGIWSIAVLFLAPSGARRFLTTGRLSLTRVELAIILSLLGTHTFASVTTAEDVLANPLVIERVVRGGLSALALLLVSTTLIGRLQRLQQTSAPALTSLTIYILVAGVSISYSVAPIVTAGKVFEIGVAGAIMWTLLLGDEPLERFIRAIRLVVILEASLIVAAVVGFFAFSDAFSSLQGRPGFVTREVMISPYAHSNSLSASGALVSAYALANILTGSGETRRLGWVGLFLFGSAGMLLSSGRQGIIIWLAAAAVLLWTHRRRLFVMLIGPAIAAVVYVNWSELLAIFSRNQPTVTLVTWSGRFDYWNAAIEAWHQHPWTGYGFGAGGRFVALASIGQGSVSSLHSGYFEALIGLGILGVIPLLLTVVMVVFWSTRQLISRALTPLAILVVPLLLHTSVALGFGAWLQADFFLLAFLAGLSDLYRDRGYSATPGEKTASMFPDQVSQF